MGTNPESVLEKNVLLFFASKTYDCSVIVLDDSNHKGGTGSIESVEIPDQTTGPHWAPTLTLT